MLSAVSVPICRGGSRISEGGVLTWALIYVVRKFSMWRVLYLGGLGDAVHRKILQIWPTEIKFSSNFE